jgi:hypothetical protein
MRAIAVDDLPGLANSGGPFRLRTLGSSAFIQWPGFIARISLESGRVAWLAERPSIELSESARNLPRRICVWGNDLWCDETDELIAELSPTADGGVVVYARQAATGQPLWEHFIPMPAAASWSEPLPAWPGAPTEEIKAFFASDSSRLVVCLSRQSRRTRIYSPAITVDYLPPYACQLDAIRLDALGRPVWQEVVPDVYVGILERYSFSGIWSFAQRIGVLDFDTGANRILHELPRELGWPVRDGALVAVPWRSDVDVGVSWLDERGENVRQVRRRQPRAKSTVLHVTDGGLALQINAQTLCWIGNEAPLWTIRAKPFIYKAHACPGGDVFVGTDGNGGRVVAFDAVSGEQTLHLKPLRGGAGDLAKPPAHDVLVARFGTSRRDWAAGSLLVLNMRDGTHRLEYPCRALLGIWNHGAIIRTGINGDRLAIVDLR